MMEQQPPQGGMRQDWEIAGGFVALAARSLAATVEVFLHKPGTFGERYAGIEVGLGFLIILLYPGFWPGSDVTGLVWFMLAYLVMLAWIRMSTAAGLRRGGPRQHSFYSGAPRIMRLFPRMSEEKIKCGLEPLATAAAGFLLMEWSEPLGGYLVLAAVGLFVSTNLATAGQRRRLTDLNDAFIEQRGLAEKFRDMRRD